MTAAAEHCDAFCDGVIGPYGEPSDDDGRATCPECRAASRDFFRLISGPSGQALSALDPDGMELITDEVFSRRMGLAELRATVDRLRRVLAAAYAADVIVWRHRID